MGLFKHFLHAFQKEQNPHPSLFPSPSKSTSPRMRSKFLPCNVSPDNYLSTFCGRARYSGNEMSAFHSLVSLLKFMGNSSMGIAIKMYSHFFLSWIAQSGLHTQTLNLFEVSWVGLVTIGRHNRQLLIRPTMFRCSTPLHSMHIRHLKLKKNAWFWTSSGPGEFL